MSLKLLSKDDGGVLRKYVTAGFGLTQSLIGILGLLDAKALGVMTAIGSAILYAIDQLTSKDK